MLEGDSYRSIEMREALIKNNFKSKWAAGNPRNRLSGKYLKSLKGDSQSRTLRKS